MPHNSHIDDVSPVQSFGEGYGEEWSDTHAAWDLQSGLVHVRGFADPLALVAPYQIMDCEEDVTEHSLRGVHGMS